MDGRVDGRHSLIDDAERARLEAIFAARAELARAWSMLQELYGPYAAEDLAGAEEHLDSVRSHVGSRPAARVLPGRLGHPPVGVGDLQLPPRRPLVQGGLEGTNNLLGVLKRMGFGFVNATNFEAR